MRRRVYIAGPISRGDLAHNVNQATEAFVALAKAGFAPLCPHWSVYAKPARSLHYVGPDMAICDGVWCRATIHGNDDMAHADWLGVDLPWVEVADAVLRLPGESAGADAEEAHARRHRRPVLHSVADVIAWGRLHKAPDYLLPVEVN